MKPLGVTLNQPVGFIEFDGVWLDDRARCTWGLQNFSLVVTPGQTVALLDDDPSDRASHGALDLLIGRRHPVRGTVMLDGIRLPDLLGASRDAAVAELCELTNANPPEEGERRIVIAGRTTLVADPRPLTVAAADQVVVLVHGTPVATGTHRELMLAGGRYAKRFQHVAAA